jgi:hypothetical protein
VSLEVDKKVVKNGILLELLFIGFEEKLEAREFFFPFFPSTGKQAYFL